MHGLLSAVRARHCTMNVQSHRAPRNMFLFLPPRGIGGRGGCQRKEQPPPPLLSFIPEESVSTKENNVPDGATAETVTVDGFHHRGAAKARCAWTQTDPPEHETNPPHENTHNAGATEGCLLPPCPAPSLLTKLLPTWSRFCSWTRLARAQRCCAVLYTHMLTHPHSNQSSPPIIKLPSSLVLLAAYHHSRLASRRDR